MNPKEQVAIIAGVTGLSGMLLLHELLKRQDFAKIKVITRRPLKISDPRVEQIMIHSLNEIHASDPRFKANVYFCCLGTTIKKAGSKDEFRRVDLTAVKNFGEAAKAHGAQGFLLISAMGANSESLIFYNQVKGDAERAILDLKIPGTVIFRPALLIGQRREERFFEKLSIKIVQGISTVLPQTWIKKISTQVEALVARMITESLKSDVVAKIITADQI